MSHLRNIVAPHNNGRSRAFLLGLACGLLLLLLLVWLLNSVSNTALANATNIYGLQALAGAILGFWWIRKRADNPRTIPAIASVWICFGLLIWTIAQGVWTWGAFHIDPNASNWWDNIFYIAAELIYIVADVCWLVALVYVFKSLRRRVLTAISPLTAILIAVLGLLLSGFYVWFDREYFTTQWTAHIALKLFCDLVNILLTFSSMSLAVALLIGENREIPFPVEQCIRYLCVATAINAVSTFAFLITASERLKESSLAYYNGNWVDWLFLTATYCWGVSALRWPIKEEELRYTFGSKRSGLGEEDIYRASEIAEHCCSDEHEAARVAAYTSSIRWILDNIPECWRVVKLGDLVVGSTFLFPVPHPLMDSFVAGKTTEREMFEEVRRNPLTWDYLYLADASIRVSHRRRGLAFKCFRETIELLKRHNPQLKLCCRPNNPDEKGLASKLEKHFESQSIHVLRVEGNDVSDNPKPT